MKGFWDGLPLVKMVHSIPYDLNCRFNCNNAAVLYWEKLKFNLENKFV